LYSFPFFLPPHYFPSFLPFALYICCLTLS
jgi:hypothetical protein